MSQVRPCIPSEDCDTYYHCMSRCVHGRHLLDDVSKEMLRRMMWKVSEFCGVDVITYAVMPNHFHVLIRIPQRVDLDDEEILRRYRLLHPIPSSFQTARIEVISNWLRNNTPEGIAWRDQQLALMFNLSAFMQLLKQRFSKWYNKTHHLFGVFWAERFKSVLVQFDGRTLQTMAAYIDLNAVRKGLVNDPKDHRFCGYAEALAGSRRARQGLQLICPNPSWLRSLSDYRTLLYASGSAPRKKGQVIPSTAFNQVFANNGQLPLPERLRHRWRFLTDAVVLGHEAFILEQRARFTAIKTTSQNRPPSTPPLPPCASSQPSPSRPLSSPAPSNPPPSDPQPLPATPWGGWTTFHRLNRHRFD